MLAASEIKRKREEKNWTTNELAEKVGVSLASIHYWEAGRYTPTDINMEKLKHVFASGLKSKKSSDDNLKQGVDVSYVDGNLVTSSRNVAENFNKEHRNVLRDIRGLLKNERVKGMFYETTYIHELNNQEFTQYLITRDGFALLTMGFTGEKALSFKLKYIEQFNKMEKEVMVKQPSYVISDPVARAEAWIAEQKEKEELQLTTAKQEQIIGELKPSADYTDTILQTTNTVNITQIAKDYALSGQGLNDLLHDLGVQYKQNGQWLLYSKHQGKGYTKSYTHKFRMANGEHGSAMNTKWTQKGRLFLYNLLKDNDINPVIEQ